MLKISRFPKLTAALALSVALPVSANAASVSTAWTEVALLNLAVSAPIFFPFDGEPFVGPEENTFEFTEGNGIATAEFVGEVEEEPPLSPSFIVQATAKIPERTNPLPGDPLGLITDISFAQSSSSFQIFFQNTTDEDVTIFTQFAYNLGVSTSFDEEANFVDPSTLIGEFTDASARVGASYSFFGDRENETIFSEAFLVGENEEGAQSLIERGSFVMVETMTIIAPGEAGFLTFGGSTQASALTGSPVAPVPLPASLPLTLAALGGLGLIARRRRSA